MTGRILLGWLLFAGAGAKDALAFEDPVRAILSDRCLTCHSAKEQKGDLDLERFSTVADIEEDPAVWEHVVEQIELGEMPPKKEKPMPDGEKKALVSWVRRTLDTIALKHAGDPGPVVLRRLSNAEYTYTIRDLTGVDALDPAREFPVDGAAGEGFSNAGAALVMSPALLTKYLDAAKEVARHAVLTPHGIRFSASESQRDWTDETLARIRTFYAARSAAMTLENEVSGAGKVPAQGGGLPLDEYLDALQGRGGGEAAGLSPKYLGLLRRALEGGEPSALLDPLRAKYRAKTLVAADIEPWRRVLWRFTTVGHIGKLNGPKAWQEPVTPLVARQEIRVKLDTDANDEKELTLYLDTSNAGDGGSGDEVIWENPRLVAKGRPDLPIGGLSEWVMHLESQRAKIIASTETCLNVLATGDDKSGADAGLLAAWREYLGYGTTQLEPLLTKKLEGLPDYAFIQGWQAEQALSVIANSSDATVRVPGVMKAHSVAMHPSPTRSAVIAWRSPVRGMLVISGRVTDAHPECGNGVTWALETRRGHIGETLASGFTQGATPVTIGPFEKVPIEPGQVIALVIGPRDGSHACDLTAVDLTITDGRTTWDLARDVSPNILGGNPLGPWHFASQPATDEAAVAGLPAPITEWRKHPSPALAAKVREFLERDFPLDSPLLARAVATFHATTGESPLLRTRAPSVLEVKIPAVLARGAEFVVTARLAPDADGSVQMRVLTEKPETEQGLIPGRSESAQKSGRWSDNNLVTQHSTPVIVNDGSAARRRFEADFEKFRALFPIALCYTKIVPVDEVVTLTLFHREDDHLKRLILDEAESRELDALWDELLYVSEAPLKQVDAYEQLWQFATQDADPKAFEPMREPILKAAAAFRESQAAAGTAQRESVIAFAEKAWRRPLAEAEMSALRGFPPRLMLTRVLTSPSFLYRGEQAREKTGPVSDWELATRLSYFLTSSAPDDDLRALAATGKLSDPAVLAAEARRLLKSDRVRRLATEFGCQWLHVRDVATLDEKSERHFPSFLDLRDDMQEEVTLFFTDLFQNDGRVMSLLDADHTFVNAALAGHYGIDAPESSDAWQRVDGLREKGRGGVLGFAATLSKHSGASRTSAILRGTWVSEVLLGDTLPIPPKGVPVLPEEAPEGLTERQLIERHSSDENCAGCHRRIDPFGFALEGFDAIGRARSADTRTVLHDGAAIDGLAGLREYLTTGRRADFLRQFSRKLLGYALGRAVQLSDQPLIDEMVRAGDGDPKMSDLVGRIVLSRQFREVRGREE